MLFSKLLFIVNDIKVRNLDGAFLKLEFAINIYQFQLKASSLLLEALDLIAQLDEDIAEIDLVNPLESEDKNRKIRYSSAKKTMAFLYRSGQELSLPNPEAEPVADFAIFLEQEHD